MGDRDAGVVDEDVGELLEDLFRLTLRQLLKQLEEAPTAALLTAALKLLDANDVSLGGRLGESERDIELAKLAGEVPFPREPVFEDEDGE